MMTEITFGITIIITLLLYTSVLATSDRAMYVSSVVLNNIIDRVINCLGYISCGLVDTMMEKYLFLHELTQKQIKGRLFFYDKNEYEI